MKNLSLSRANKVVRNKRNFDLGDVVEVAYRKRQITPKSQTLNLIMQKLAEGGAFVQLQ